MADDPKNSYVEMRKATVDKRDYLNSIRHGLMDYELRNRTILGPKA